MKRYYIILVVLFALVLAIGLSMRPAPMVREADARPAPTAQPTPVPYRQKEYKSEPFLYAVPLGYFTPHNDLSVFEWPGAAAPVVGSLKIGERVGYTSEYRTAEGDLWLCVQWNIAQDVMGWECTGWSIGSMGKIEREWEYTPEQDDAREQA